MPIDKNHNPVIELRQGEGCKGNQKKTGHNGTTTNDIMILVEIDGTGKRSFCFADHGRQGSP